LRPTPPWLADGPLDPRFWSGEISARLPALFRIGLGAILLGDALLAIPDVDALYGQHGVWPARLGRGPLSQASDGLLHATWGLGCVALLAFSAGLFTRVAALAAWLFLVALHQRNPGITTGGDYLAQILLFFCVFLDCGAALSLDARWRKRGRAFVAAAPLRAMQLHVAVLYLAATRLKLRGGWLSGDGVYLSLQHDGFLRPLGAWLRMHPDLCRLSNFNVLLLEGAFAFLAFSPLWSRKLRLAAVACALAVQLGILALMRVGMFTPLMLWVNVLFLPAAVRASEPALAVRRAFYAASCASLVILLAWGVIAARRFPLPQRLVAAMDALGLEQPYDLFGATYEVSDWRAVGSAAGVAQPRVIERVEPGLLSEVGWRYSSFYKLTFAHDADYGAIGRWLCRGYQRETGTRLDRLKLFKLVRSPDRALPPREVSLYDGPCAER
jgi:hypothetical protein